MPWVALWYACLCTNLKSVCLSAYNQLWVYVLKINKKNAYNWNLKVGLCFWHGDRCDRILWKGEGMKQMWYGRGESKISDHRPVYSLFCVQTDCNSSNKLNNNKTTPKAKAMPLPLPLPTTGVAKVQAEELLPVNTRFCYHWCWQKRKRLLSIDLWLFTITV